MSTEGEAEVGAAGLPLASAALACLCACIGLLGGCQTRAPDGTQYGVTARAVSGDAFLLAEPELGVSRGVLFVRGRICSRGAATAWPPGILVTGYDASHRPTFERPISMKATAAPDEGCRGYAAALRGVRMPVEIEVRAVSGADGAR